MKGADHIARAKKQRGKRAKKHREDVALYEANDQLLKDMETYSISSDTEDAEGAVATAIAAAAAAPATN